MSEPTSENYYDIIDRCAQEKLDLEISNGNAKHAAYLLKTFFQYAEKHVSIYTGELYSGVFDDEDLRKHALAFMGKEGASLSIIYQDAIDPDAILGRTLIRDILDLKDRKGVLSIYDGQDIDIKDIPHFAVMDDTGYRVEINHDERMAEANFGDKKNAPKIFESFKRLTGLAKQVPLPELAN
jgi:hypothetical protein